MTLPSSGTIRTSQVNTELGLPTNTSIRLNQTSVRRLADITTPNSTIAMSNLYGKTWFGGVYTNQTGLAATTFGTAYVYGLVWTGSIYVAVGSSGRVATSTNAVTWTYQSGLSTATNWGPSFIPALSIAWSGTQFVVGGGFGGIATSP